MGVEQFGPRLKALREQAGLSQQALAERVGLSRVGISRLEQGERSPTWKHVLALADALAVSTEAFREPPAGGRPSKRPAPSTQKRGSK